jgi:hypothetical protein
VNSQTQPQGDLVYIRLTGAVTHINGRPYVAKPKAPVKANFAAPAKAAAAPNGFDPNHNPLDTSYWREVIRQREVEYVSKKLWNQVAGKA